MALSRSLSMAVASMRLRRIFIPVNEGGGGLPPSNALLNENGEPILNEDGSYILAEE